MAYFEKAKIKSLCHFTKVQLKAFPTCLCRPLSTSCGGSGVDWRVLTDFSTWKKHMVDIL